MTTWPPKSPQSLANFHRFAYGTPFPGVPELSAVRELNHTQACPMPPHLHPGQIEITYIQRGSVSWWIGEQAMELTGGDVCVSRPDEPHGSRTDSMEPVKLYGVTLQLPTGDSDFLKLPTAEGAALAEAVRNLPRRFRATPSLAESFKLARAARLAEPTQLNTASMRGHLVALLADIVAASSNSSASAGGSNKISMILELMSQNLETPLTLDELAAAVDWSLASLKARFRAETGTTPARHYLRLRVLEGLRRLNQPGESITSVAYMMGFSSSQYFATCVRRITNKSPSEFRSE